MIRRLTGQLPDWARAEHPMLRQELGRGARIPWRARYARASAVVMIGLLLVVGGYLIATRLLTQPAGQDPIEITHNVLYFPLLALQVLLRIAALTMTSTVVSEQIRRQNWDNLRATESGAELTLRARWASVFYRVRGLLIVIVGVRVVLVGMMLWELTAFQGRYLDLLINGITPDVSLVAAVLLLSFLMTSAVLLPLTAVGFDASLGLMVSAFVQGRTVSTMLQGLLILLRAGLVAALVYGATQFFAGQVSPEIPGFPLMLAFGAMGDWGLAFLLLGRFGEVWATVPYGIFLGLGLLIFALVQAFIADRLLIIAVRAAQRRG